MAIELRLTSTVRAILDWEEIDTDAGISLQSDLGQEAEGIRYSYGTGDFQINEAWYKEIEIGANSNQVIDLHALPATILNLNLNKRIDRLKGLIVENGSANGVLIIGQSGTTDAVNFLANMQEVGYSGVYEFVSQVGTVISSGKSKFNIHNPNSTAITVKVLAIGIKN